MSKPVVFALLVLSGLAVGARSLSAQSLADVAKKEEERRKAIRAPAKVYTNKDLGAAPAGSPPVATPAADASKAKDTKDKDAKDKDAKDAKGAGTKDQAYWSGRQKDLQTQLDRDQSFAEAIQTRINALSTDFVNRDDPAQKAAIDRDRQKAVVELARLTKAIQDDKKALTDFQDEARRAGVPPGWLR
jgi:hypothetical protein